MKKSKIVLAVASAFLLAACSGKKVDKVKPSDLPKSGAKTFVTSPTGAMQVISQLAEDLDDFDGGYVIESYFEDVYDIEEVLGDLGENSESAKKITSVAEKVEEAYEKFSEDLEKNKKGSIKVDASLGKLKDLPEGLTVNVPTLKVNADVELSGEEKVSIKGSGSAKGDIKFKDVELSLKKLDVNCDVSGKVVQTNVDAKAKLAVKASADLKVPGFECSVKDLAFDMNAKDVDVDVAKYALKGAVNASSVADLKLRFNYDELIKPMGDSHKKELAAFPIKGIVVNFKSSEAEKLNAKESVSLADIGNLTVNVDEYIGLNAGISFCTSNKVGGIFIAELLMEIKAKTTMNELTAKFEELLKGESKLSEKEFKKLKLPLEASAKVAFYDDDGKETYCVVEAKNLYEVYSLIYDSKDSIVALLNGELPESADVESDSYSSDLFGDAYDDALDTYRKAYDEALDAYGKAYDEALGAYGDAYKEAADALGAYGDLYSDTLDAYGDLYGDALNDYADALDAYGDLYSDSLDALNGALDLYGSLY